MQWLRNLFSRRQEAERVVDLPVVPEPRVARVAAAPEAVEETPMVTVELVIAGESIEIEVPQPNHLLTVEGYAKPFHHVSTREDGVWVFEPVR